MSQPLKVLLVDDAVVVRRALSDLLAKDPALEVVGTARDGRDGLDKLRLKPDIIVLDVEMPELDGLQMLSELRRRGDKTPVVMFSSVTARAAEATLAALAKGASDYVTKPTTRGSGIDQVVPELIAKLKLHGAAARRAKSRVQEAAPKQANFVLRRAPAGRPRVVVVAASTGGPIALSSFLARLPEQLAVPVLVVQHMPTAVFTEALTQSLSKLSKLPVEHASAGRALAAGVVVVAPGGSHLVVGRSLSDGQPSTKLTLEPPLNGVRPAADALFKSAVAAYGPSVLGVVLTGMGQDGLHGAEAIVQAGGSVIVQDEASSVIWGMPGAVAKAGLASAVLPLTELGAEVGRRLGLASGAATTPKTRGEVPGRAQLAAVPPRARRT